MKRSLLVILIIAIYGVTAATFWATSVSTVTIYAYKDSYSWQSVPEANNGGSNNFEITSYNKPPFNMRGWIEFNITSIPSDEWIISAKLRLRVWHKTTIDPTQNMGDTTGRVYGAYRITQPWTESGVNWANQPNYTEEHHATAAVPSGQGGWYGPLLWMEWDLMGMMEDWRSGTNNYGLVVRDTQEYAPIFYSTQFFTHNQVPNESYYPRLVVTYVWPQALVGVGIVFVAEGCFIILLWRMKFKRSSA
jgi:hypothetical protein